MRLLDQELNLDTDPWKTMPMNIFENTFFKITMKRLFYTKKLIMNQRTVHLKIIHITDKEISYHTQANIMSKFLSITERHLSVPRMITVQYEKYICTFDILEITPNTLLIPGLNLIQITTNRVITPTERIWEILLFRNLNTTFEMKSKAAGDLNILWEYDSTLWYREIEFDKIAIRIRLKNERIQTKRTLISVKTNSILIDVAPRILWSVQITINNTSAMRSEILPQKLYLSINQFSFNSKRLTELLSGSLETNEEILIKYIMLILNIMMPIVRYQIQMILLKI